MREAVKRGRMTKKGTFPQRREETPQKLPSPQPRELREPPGSFCHHRLVPAAPGLGVPMCWVSPDRAGSRGRDVPAEPGTAPSSPQTGEGDPPHATGQDEFSLK